MSSFEFHRDVNAEHAMFGSHNTMNVNQGLSAAQAELRTAIRELTTRLPGGPLPDRLTRGARSADPDPEAIEALVDQVVERHGERAVHPQVTAVRDALETLRQQRSVGP